VQETGELDTSIRVIDRHQGELEGEVITTISDEGRHITMNTLSGKVALVTGAGSKKGMGRAVAVQLAADGADVVIVDRFGAPESIWPGDEGWKGLDAVVEEIKAHGRQALALVADISASDDVDRVMAKTLERFGKIDILAHCAGVRGPAPVPVVELDEKTWRMLLDINLTGSFLISKAVAKTMIPDGEGKKIVIISSLAGRQAFPGGAGYCAAKHGVIGLVKSLAAELARYNINVNCVNPGAIDTNFRDEAVKDQAKVLGITPAEATKIQPGNPPPRMFARLGTPQEVADLVSFLVSDRSTYITGEDINISGGVL
jgi:NAD(P)-dependent dehydrogenase (short-subunit alcohol dehydrogenase family)